MNLKLALNRSSLDVGYDQGYGSERSPEEDFPPMPIPQNSLQAHKPTAQKLKSGMDKVSENDFSFITKGEGSKI